MNDSPIIKAINLLRDGKIDDSRDEIGISNSDMSDQNYIQQISSLSTGLELVTSDQVIESIDHFQNSLELVEKCSDQEIKILVPLLIQYGNGLNQLHSGDAFGAYQSLQNVANEVNQLAFFDDELKKFATSAKASACIAIARTHISGGNVDDAQKWMAKAESIYDEVLDLLDEENPEDLPAFVEVYGLPVEIGAYWAFFDLQVLQIEEAQKRLELATEKISTASRSGG